MFVGDGVDIVRKSAVDGVHQVNVEIVHNYALRVCTCKGIVFSQRIMRICCVTERTLVVCAYLWMNSVKILSEMISTLAFKGLYRYMQELMILKFCSLFSVSRSI